MEKLDNSHIGVVLMEKLDNNPIGVVLMEKLDNSPIGVVLMEKLDNSLFIPDSPRVSIVNMTLLMLSKM
jgi:hypothetical protein